MHSDSNKILSVSVFVLIATIFAGCATPRDSRPFYITQYKDTPICPYPAVYLNELREVENNMQFEYQITSYPLFNIEVENGGVRDQILVKNAGALGSLFKIGDHILSINGIEISGYSKFRNVWLDAIGNNVAVVVTRGGKEWEIHVADIPCRRIRGFEHIETFYIGELVGNRQIRLASFPFVVQSDRPHRLDKSTIAEFGKSIERVYLNHAMKFENVRLVNRSEMERLSNEILLNQYGITQESDELNYGKMLGANYILKGHIFVSAGTKTIMVSVEITEIESGETRAIDEMTLVPP